MRYLGGKTRLAKPIAEVIASMAEGRTTYVEPFMGGCSVLAEVAPKFDRVIGADLMPDLVMMWREAQNGWVPPTSVTEDEYQAIRRAEPSEIRGFIGFACSFGAKWFGGYARDPKGGTNYAAQGSRAVQRKAAKLRGVEIRLSDYRALSDVIGPDTVVYADPPYANTTGYSATGSFDHEEFWRTMDEWVERGARVLVSEFQAPSHWREVWSVERHSSVALNSTGARAVDKVFTRE